MAPLAARDGTLDRMASFAQQLERLLLAAQARGLVESGLAEQLTALAAERERERGWLSLGGVLGRLGGAVTIVGVVLLIAANWRRGCGCTSKPRIPTHPYTSVGSRPISCCRSVWGSRCSAGRASCGRRTAASDR